MFVEHDPGTVDELAVVDAPLSVETFVMLARKGFYDGLTFHRVVPDFVIQGGDPRSAEGGPGFTIRDELTSSRFLRGSVGLALDWEDTGGSQFFVAVAAAASRHAYTVIGRVISGVEVVNRFSRGMSCGECGCGRRAAVGDK